MFEGEDSTKAPGPIPMRGGEVHKRGGCGIGAAMTSAVCGDGLQQSPLVERIAVRIERQMIEQDQKGAQLQQTCMDLHDPIVQKVLRILEFAGLKI